MRNIQDMSMGCLTCLCFTTVFWKAEVRVLLLSVDIVLIDLLILFH